MPKLTLVQAINDGLKCEMERDKRVILLGEDIGVNGGVFRATEKLYELFGPKRVIDTPLAESGIVGFSIGLAIGGFKPVAEIQFMGFLYPALNQLFAHAARFRNRSRGKYNIQMVLRMPYGGGIHPPEHHSESYEALLLATPGLKVVVSSTPYDAKGLLISSIRDEDPVVFLEPKRIYRSFKEEVPEDIYTIPLGKLKKVKEGKDITVIGWGSMIPYIIEAEEMLRKDKIDIEILDLRTLNPLDLEGLLESVKKTHRALIVHEAPKYNGFGAEISALISERAILYLEAPVERLCGFDCVFPFPLLEEYYLPNPKRIYKAVHKVLSF